MHERSLRSMAGLWNRWSGVRVGEARVPGPFDFDDPDAQPSVEEGSSGDDWQGADVASGELPGW